MVADASCWFCQHCFICLLMLLLLLLQSFVAVAMMTEETKSTLKSHGMQRTGRIVEDGDRSLQLIQQSLLYLDTNVAIIVLAIICRCCYDDGRNKIYTLQSRGLFQQAGWQRMVPNTSCCSSHHCSIS